MAVIGLEGAQCRICGEWRPQDWFYVRNEKTGNRFSDCKACRTVQSRVNLGLREQRVVLPKPHDRDRAEKPCPDCGRTLDIEDFPLKNSKTGQRRHRCKACHNANTRSWKQENPKHKKETDRAYYEANREAVQERQKQWRAEHPAEYTAIHSRWKQRNKAAVNAATHRRRNNLNGADGHWTAAEWEALKAEYGYRCLMCGRQEPDISLTVDHIVPVSRGGSNGIDNLQPLCKSCNSFKHQGIVDLRRRRE